MPQKADVVIEHRIVRIRARGKGEAHGADHELGGNPARQEKVPARFVTREAHAGFTFVPYCGAPRSGFNSSVTAHSVA